MSLLLLLNNPGVNLIEVTSSGDISAQTATYNGLLVFPHVFDAYNNITHPEVKIPLYIKEHSIPIRQPKITQVNTIDMADPVGWETGINLLFYGANEPLQAQISGFFITPLDGSGKWAPTNDGTPTGASLGLTGYSYADLISAYIEGRMSVSSTGRYVRRDPAYYIDPYGKEYSNVVIALLDTGYAPVAKRQTFTMTLYLNPMN